MRLTITTALVLILALMICGLSAGAEGLPEDVRWTPEELLAKMTLRDGRITGIRKIEFENADE